ncbi:MAG: site-specific integrase [Actinomycetota bacterium]|nr:site-specific integrase [Actinomycetota bacterium]
MGHVEDRWWNGERDPETGKQIKVKTDRHGRGSRYRVRYLDPEGRERNKSFGDRQKKAAEDFLIKVEGDKRQGTYIDPDAGRLTFGEYVKTWLASQTFDVSTRNSVTWRLNAQILPFFERRQLGAIRPTDVRSWIRGMQERNSATSYQAGCFAHLSSIMSAAVDDKLIRENPCHARTVVRPRPVPPKIVPWSRARIAAMRLAMPERHKLAIVLGAGCGLRQGEFFGVSPDDFDREAGVLRVVRQVRVVDGKQVFSLPKRNKTREVPVAQSVLRLLDEHMERFEPAAVTLPWRIPTGAPTTVRLLITDAQGKPLWRNRFNDRSWNPARTAAGLKNPTRMDGTHALRHHFASVLLDAGESIKALSEYLGHHDPGFTLRTYTHLMPNSAERTRRAIDGLLGGPGITAHGPETAQSGVAGI